MIKWFYQKIFIAIVQDNEDYDVRVLVTKSGNSSFKEAKQFEGESALSSLLEFVQKKISDSPLYYISILNTDPRQGALTGCDDSSIEEVLKDAKIVCRNKGWILYSSIREIETIKKKFALIGVDYLFSPFSILEVFFKDKIQGGLALYALVQKGSFSIALFDHGKLEYAHHYRIHHESENLLVDEEPSIGFSVGVEDDINSTLETSDIDILDDLDLIDDLEVFNDIQDLDTLEELVEFSEDEPTPEELRLATPDIENMKNDINRFGDNYTRFECIQKTLTYFYGMEACRNRFVESVYLADSYGMGLELKNYLEEELFLNVSVRRINLADEVLALSLEEGT